VIVRGEMVSQGYPVSFNLTTGYVFDILPDRPVRIDAVAWERRRRVSHCFREQPGPAPATTEPTRKSSPATVPSPSPTVEPDRDTSPPADSSGARQIDLGHGRKLRLGKGDHVTAPGSGR
jgi:hypothetical protein